MHSVRRADRTRPTIMTGDEDGSLKSGQMRSVVRVLPRFSLEATGLCSGPVCSGRIQDRTGAAAEKQKEKLRPVCERDTTRGDTLHRRAVPATSCSAV
jgi:hypothetical protein